MSRLVRALLGLPKPKGNDEREPDDDDPPWPDVTIVVIINKRSGSRLVRTVRPVRVKRRENALSLPHLFPRRISLFRPPRGSAILTAPRLILKSNHRACNSRAN